MIERLSAPASDADIRGLALVLMDAIDSGAAASFLAPLSEEVAEAWWRDTIASAGRGAVFLVARDEDGTIVGTVHLLPAWAPNQPHRADIAKLLVHRRARRRGLGARLMQAIEAEARLGGYSVLTLDTRRGDTADRLYRRLGWTVVGTIPRFAMNTDGVTPHDAVVFYKDLE
jgi:GNAT superfamily N-acetyltransferase